MFSPCDSFRPVARAVAGAALASTVAVATPPLRPETQAGWRAYVAAVEQRVAADTATSAGFLNLDGRPDAAARRRALLAGEVLIEELIATRRDGSRVEVPVAMVHHWLGAIFIPGTTVGELLAALESGVTTAQEDVLESRVLARGPDSLRLHLRLQRTKIVTVVYNTEHDVRFRRHGSGHASSTSVATKIAEVSRPATPAERELGPGEDRGFLWRWNAYWRYLDVAGGVLVECESVSLSRDVPGVVRMVAAPLIRSTARESMARTLEALRKKLS